MPNFYVVPTLEGSAKMANAMSLGKPFKLTHMVVGDGGGALPVPDPKRKTLINEKRRAPINTLSPDKDNPGQFIAEQVIPPNEGGWWIREFGLLDEDGTLCYYGNCPETYKPLLAEGSARTQAVRMVIIPNEGVQVELKVDPAIVLATRQYADTQIAAALDKRGAKQSVLVATTASLDALSGLLTVDGVKLDAGTRVLVKDQAAAKDNGIYVAAAGAWSRATDADNGAKVTPGMMVTIEQGKDNGDSVWLLVTDGVITVGTTALAFEMIAGRTGVVAGKYWRVNVSARGIVVGGENPVAAEDTAGPASIATQDEVNAGADDKKFVTAKKLFNWVKQATEAALGMAKVATQAQTDTGTDDATIVTPKKLLNWVKQATEAVLGMAKVATQAQTDAGTDDATIVTPKKLRSGFSVLLSANGYIVFPSWLGGWIVQWGIGPTSYSGGYSGVTFPIAFPNVCLTVICSYNGAGGTVAATPTIVTAGAISRTSCNLYTYLGTSPTNGTTPAYIAFGR